MNEGNKTTQENQQQNEPTGQLGRHDESAKADVPVFKPKGGPWVLRTLMIVIMILLLALAGLFGWLWWQERNDDEQQNASTQNTQQAEESQQAESKCSEDFSIYTSEDLNIEFCYPTAWGQVELTDARLLSEPSEGFAADSGSRWRLSFSEESAVNLGLVSTDWSTNVGRDGTCTDPATQVLPEFSPFSTEWSVEIESGTPPQPDSAIRGVEVEEDKYLIQEHVDNLLTNGVCLKGYTIIDNETYPHATASYSADFNDEVSTPQQHMDNPDILIPSADRTDFATLINSIKAYEE